MKSLLVLFIVFACMALSVDYLWTGYGHDEVKVFQYIINKSDMITFTDDMYCYDISYPDFLYPAEDNADGANRFNYNGRTDLMVETTVIDSIQYLKQNSDKIIQERDCVYIDGDYMEGDKSWEDMRFHTKAVHSGKLWVTYTVVFNKKFEQSVSRMISIIDQCNPKTL